MGEARNFPILQVPYLLFGVSLIEPHSYDLMQACTDHLWINVYTVSMLTDYEVSASNCMVNINEIRELSNDCLLYRE